MTQYETEVERLRREKAELERKLKEEEAKRAEETAMAVIWGRSRTRGMRMQLGAEAALGEGWF
jgi:cell shape-determining protein MreC